MRMRISAATVALAALVLTGCPYDHVSNSLGIAIAGGGGGGGGANVLAFLQQPLTGTAGEILTPALLVGAADTLGNADTSFSATVTIALATNPAGATLSGTRSVAAVRGVASFGDLVIDKASSGYVLRVTAPNATAASTAAITILAQ